MKRAGRDSARAHVLEARGAAGAITVDDLSAASVARTGFRVDVHGHVERDAGVTHATLVACGAHAVGRAWARACDKKLAVVRWRRSRGCWSRRAAVVPKHTVDNVPHVGICIAVVVVVAVDPSVARANARVPGGRPRARARGRALVQDVKQRCGRNADKVDLLRMQCVTRAAINGAAAARAQSMLSSILQ
jgi:hypothetical protein